jgi:hypothetical protein
MRVRIEVLYFEGCPHHKPVVKRVRAVLAEEEFSAELSEIEVPDAETARATGFLGSPTVRVNGIDIEPGSRAAREVGFACRRYAGSLPSEEMIRAALWEAKAREQ